MMRDLRETWVKICGITNLEDAFTAAEFGADAVGFVFAQSRRQIDPDLAKKIVRQCSAKISTVGVFFNQTLEDVRRISDQTGIDWIQLHGSESPDFCGKAGKRVIKRIQFVEGDTVQTLTTKMEPYTFWTLLLDPGEGSGVPFRWEIAEGITKSFVVAGGLNPKNVGEVVRKLHPLGVDVSSGVEDASGKKDRQKIQKFIQEVRIAESSAG